MNSKAENESRWKRLLEEPAIAKINAYCRVLELHIRAVAEGVDPGLSKNQPLRESVKIATEGLLRELQFLDFVRSQVMESPEGK